MRGRLLSFACAGALLCTGMAGGAQAGVSADINVHVGDRPAPVVVFDREPDVVMILDGLNDLTLGKGSADGLASAYLQRMREARDVARGHGAAVVFALTRPDGCEVKEIVVTGPTETSWP